MFGIRRYRLFLFVAALSAVTVYYLSKRGLLDVVEIERTGQTSLKHDLPGMPTEHDSSTDQPLPPSLPEDTVELIAAPSAKTSSRIEPFPSTSSSVQAKPSSSSIRSHTYSTTFDEKLLAANPDLDDAFEEEPSGRSEGDTTPDDGRKPRWQKPRAHYPLDEQDIISLPSGTPQKLPTIQARFDKETVTARKDRLSKLNAIKGSFKHAWNGYKKYGQPHDEVKPISKSHADPFMGWGATLVDTLDTLWIMGLKEEFEEALAVVEAIDFTTSVRKDIPLFETVIRYLGGLLAAYDISGARYPILLSKAEELAEVLMGAFDTPNRIPVTFYHWAPSYASQPHRASTHAVMSELGSLSVEMTRLAQLTQKHEYYDAVARITDAFEVWQPGTLMPGLWPLKVDGSGCKKSEHGLNEDDRDSLVKTPVLIDADVFDINGEEPAVLPGDGLSDGRKATRNDVVKRAAAVQAQGLSDEKSPPPPRKIPQEILAVECVSQGLSAEPHAKSQTFGIGGQADSTYEYLPKMHQLLHGRTEQYRSMYMDAVNAIRNELLFRPMIKDRNRDILFVASHELNPKAKSVKKRNITTYEVTHLSCFVGGMFGLGARLFGIEKDLELAKQLTDGCIWAYESMPTGVMAESAAVVPCPGLDICSWNETKWHEALDPNQKERVSAVEIWNKNQEAIYERSELEASRPGAVDKVTGPQQTSNASSSHRERAKREVSHEEPSTTSDKVDFEEEEEERVASSPIRFVPKVALSHEKYVRARIQEERLPASYTKIFARHYGLRPEAIESVFYMFRITGDDSWRQKGWRMFEAIQSATQTDVANAAMKDVTSDLGELDDKMESFWLAETLKYFYLLFDEPDHISLDEWVANTEAHFFRLSK